LDLIAQQYNKQVQPIQESYIDSKNKTKKQWINTRANKETRYAHYNIHKDTPLQEKERWSIDLLKMALQRSKKPVVSCSFGIDSVVSIYLTRKALIELGRDPSDVDVIWNNTANEFQDVRKYAKELTEQWKLRLIETKPKKMLKQIIDDNGGITDDYFMARKGDRRKGRPLSEKCCGTLKHEPMKRAIKEHNWDLVINGLRADESRQRMQAGLRDGEFFYSIAEWKALVCRPILWWTEEDLWNYVEQEQIPYNDLYTKNLIQEYPKNLDEVIHNNIELLNNLSIDIEQLRNQQIQTVTRKQAIQMEKMGFKIFTPRTGCQICPIPIRFGYMQWMRLYYPKVYDAMVYNLGYGKVLLGMIPEEVREEIEEVMGIDISAENAHEFLKEILEYKPCTLDKFA
jgi:3'-phosphoadenosine 5'-phosphosulfate sulfotransferase (PAPS reductase)/FAD synthetase